ncbi:MAG: zinc metallopeptidase [Gammaproteobacteria bacterium]|nr:zinc metallopeptidase [Gammaproteobacteria bacterium]MDH5651909.1 zinc metallopeptidase [Gammaproteobacteria bacterium]
MHYLFVITLILLVVFGPHWWAQYTFRRYSKPMPHIPGTGGELARHLLDRFDMQDVKVEIAGREGDHYDPMDRVVRLSNANHNDNSLTAVAVAAHEVGHAIQHHRGEALLKWRSRLAVLAMVVEKIGAAALLAMPFMTLLSRAPSLGIAMVAIGLGSMLVATLVHLVTLPVELDASFGKALPVLTEGNYIQPDDEAAVRTILRAAALTYLAASLASLLNLWRWIRVLRP